MWQPCYKILKTSSDLKKLQNQNVFQAILSNFDFWTPVPLPNRKWDNTRFDLIQIQTEHFL